MLVDDDDDNDEDDDLTRIDIHRQTLLHLRRAPRAENPPRPPSRHVPQHVSARRPLGAERAAALHVGVIDPKDDGEVVVAAWEQVRKVVVSNGGWNITNMN